MANPVDISKDVWGEILKASAGSTRPLSDDTLRDLAKQRGDDPDLTVQVHRDLRADIKKADDDASGAMPHIIP